MSLVATLISISTKRSVDGISDAISINSNDFNLVTSVDVSLSNGVNNVLGNVLDLINILWKLLDQEVMALELVIEDGNTQLGAATLHTVGNCVVRTDCIISIDDSLSLLTDTTKQVECVVRHEAS